MSWDNISNILILILTFVGTCGTTFLVWKACLRPKATMHFTNGKDETTFSQHYFQYISTKYYVGPVNDGYDASAYKALYKKYHQKLIDENEFALSFRLSNIGKLQLENYHVEIDYDNGIKDIGVSANQSLIVQQCIEFSNVLNGVSIDRNISQINYTPVNNLPLNQKENKDIVVRFSPNLHAEQMELKWHIIAKDFNKEGKLFVRFTPKVDELDGIYFKNCIRDVPEGGELIEDLKPYIQQLKELLKQ